MTWARICGCRDHSGQCGKRQLDVQSLFLAFGSWIFLVYSTRWAIVVAEWFPKLYSQYILHSTQLILRKFQRHPTSISKAHALDHLFCIHCLVVISLQQLIIDIFWSTLASLLCLGWLSLMKHSTTVLHPSQHDLHRVKVSEDFLTQAISTVLL